MSSKPRPLAPFLTLRDASFRLGDRLVFENTSWTFNRGEQWAVIGPNGSGKSLLADALRGRLPLVHGELQYYFQAPPGLAPEDLIGHVSFEQRKQDLHETVVQSRWNSFEQASAPRVKEFLSYEAVMDLNPFDVSQSHSAARKVFELRRRRAVRLLHIAPFLNRTLLSLSNGETQRVRIARALCHPLRLLILDEPFAGLDVANRKYFHDLLERLMHTSLRVLLITTRPEDLPRHITHVICVDNCHVVAAGPRKRILIPSAKARISRVVKPARPAAKKSNPRQPAAVLPALVRLDRVTVRYGKAVILRALSWTMHEGESWALLGPNGSGKSTLLSLVLGDNPQVYRNHVEVFGRRRGTGESIWELKTQIGWVSPELHLHFQAEATCLETVASGFHETIGLFEPPTETQIKAARRQLALLSLSAHADAPLFSLSTGLQRMVLLGRALVKKPRLLILDEPCQGLDLEHRSLFIATVDRLLQEGQLSAIYVTHRQDEIPPSITRVLRLRQGQRC